MIKEFVSKRKKRHVSRGQAMTEFAIALPVLLMLLVGMMEVGRMIFMYTLVINASRDAVRYASAYGRSEDGYRKYLNCAGIKSVAQQSAYIVTLSTVTIGYDTGPGGTNLGNCTASSGEDSTMATVKKLDTGARVTVTVQANYSPILKLLPIASRTFTATSSRTLMGVYDLQ
jgi:Flp pilus assembly protein TadG